MSSEEEEVVPDTNIEEENEIQESQVEETEETEAPSPVAAVNPVSVNPSFFTFCQTKAADIKIDPESITPEVADYVLIHQHLVQMWKDLTDEEKSVRKLITITIYLTKAFLICFSVEFF